MSPSGIILSPVVSEKSFRLAAAGQYTFRVDPRATAPTIAAAIGTLYGVTVTAIRTASQRGKVTRYRGRAGQRSDTKKAIATLKAGQRIAGFEVEKPDKKDKKTVSAPTARGTGTGKQASKPADGTEGQATTSTTTGVTTKVRSAGAKESK